MTIYPAVALLLFPVLLLLIDLGRRLRDRQPQLSGNSAIEGAVFGLFGLLLAFTFSGAVARYDIHRELLTREVNYIGTAYLRLDLLPEQSRPALRQLFRDYITSRLNLFASVGEEVSPATATLQHQIWDRSVAAASSAEASPDATKLLLPAVNDMIDITSTRQNAFNMHPPEIVFLLLLIFSWGSAFLAGYSIPAERRNWVYSVAFSLAITITVYATLEVEFPREGLIRLTNLDSHLIALRDSMK